MSESYVTLMNESYVTLMNESYVTLMNEWHVTLMNESCVTLMDESCVTLMNELWVTWCHTHKCVMCHTHEWVVGHFDRKKPPQVFLRVSLLGGFQTKNPEEETLPEKQTRFFQKIGFVFRGGSPSSGFLVRKLPTKETRKKPRGGSHTKKWGRFSVGFLFLRVLGLETTQ